MKYTYKKYSLNELTARAVLAGRGYSFLMVIDLYHDRKIRRAVSGLSLIDNNVGVVFIDEERGCTNLETVKLYTAVYLLRPMVSKIRSAHNLQTSIEQL